MMTKITQPQRLELIPPSAPFSEEQRAWLNGFFAGLMSMDDAGVVALSPAENAAIAGGGDDGAAPWHDQTLQLQERMTLAQGRPLQRRMMAAMAQQDCGQCGYDCHNYAEALFARKEQRLNLCAPGGKETARMLKTLAEELHSAPSDIRARPFARQSGRRALFVAAAIEQARV
jgi:sulfite reductase (NADPH) flavoprotein alpha-component